jgi:hypothetical protein
MTITKPILCISGMLSLFLQLSSAQSIDSNELSLRVMVREGPRAAEGSRLWFAIENRSSRARILCKQAWDYSLLPDNTDARPFVEREVSLHGCGDKDHDAVWILLPGETRIDSIQIEAVPSPAYSLDVSVDVSEYSLDRAAAPSNRTLRWKGRLSDATAAFKLLKQ